MRLSEFWSLADDVFGTSYSRTLARELVVDAIGNCTVVAALEAGWEPRDVWHAWCDAMDVPDAARDGGDLHRVIPPRR